jgi:HAD superfamily hydrolase (TIGR01509 family)
MSEAARPGVLLDVDGTLLDSNYLHVTAWARAFDDTGHRGVAMTAIHRSIGLSSGRLTEHLLGKEDDATVEAHGKRFAELRDLVVATPGAADLVRECHRRGLAPVLATSGAESDLEWMLPAIGAGDSVAGVTSSGDVDRSKPAPDILAVAMEQNRLDPRRTVVVGDTVWDIGSAAHAGLPCIALTCGGISEPELREAGAAEVYDDPRDLLAHLDASCLRLAAG